MFYLVSTSVKPLRSIKNDSHFAVIEMLILYPQNPQMQLLLEQARVQLATLEKETSRLQQELRDGCAAADAAVRHVSL